MQPLPRRELCHRIQVGSPRRPPRGAPDGALPPVEVQGLAALAVVVAFTSLLPVGYFPESLNHASGTVGRLCVAAEFAYPGAASIASAIGELHYPPRPCHSHDHWVEKLPHPTRKYVVVAVAMEATERTVKICVPFFCKAPWEKLLHLLGRTQGGRASNLPSVNMARSCLSLPELLKQSGIRYVCSSTAGKGVKAPQGGQPHTSPTMQGGGTGPQAKVQHLSQNGYTSLSLSRCLSLAMCTNAQNRRHSFHPAAGTLTCTKLPKKHQLVQEL